MVFFVSSFFCQSIKSHIIIFRMILLITALVVGGRALMCAHCGGPGMIPCNSGPSLKKECPHEKGSVVSSCYVGVEEDTQRCMAVTMGERAGHYQQVCRVGGVRSPSRGMDGLLVRMAQCTHRKQEICKATCNVTGCSIARLVLPCQ